MAYERHDWAHGEVISEQLLDNIEEGISEAIGSASSKADKIDTILDTTLSRGRKANTTVGTGSFAFGNNVTASGNYSHAEGDITTASGAESHAEGVNTIASGNASHAEGDGSIASGNSSHAEGNSTEASGYLSHAEGYFTTATHLVQHVFGSFNVSDTSQSNSNAQGTYIEIVGNGTDSDDKSNARALDWNGNEYLNGDLYVGCNADSTGGTKVVTTVDIASKADKTPMTGATALAAGASGLVPAPSTGDNIKFLRGDGTWQDVTVGGAAIASLIFNGVEYQPTNGTVTIDGGRTANTTIGTGSFAFGNNVTASGSYSHAEGRSTVASGNSSHAEGASSAARGMIAHAEGNSCFADGNGSHAEGSHTQAYQQYSHSEGEYTYAAGRASHVSGRYNVLDGSYPEWVSGTSYVIDDKVTFGEGKFVCTAPNSDTTFDSSKWQEDKYLNFAEIVGMGAADDLRCNARALDWDGNERLKGTLYTKCNANSTGGHQVYDTSMIVYSNNTNGPANPIEGMIWLKPVE